MSNLTVDEAAAKVADATGLVLSERRSTFVGRYFRYRDSEMELQVKLNWLKDGELVRPSFPEGVFVSYSSGIEDQHAAALSTVPELKFYNKRQY